MRVVPVGLVPRPTLRLECLVGLLVCQLSAVVRHGPDGALLGVDFPTECLVRQGDDGPSTFPGPGSASFWARARRTLGLIEATPLAPGDARGPSVASRG